MIKPYNEDQPKVEQIRKMFNRIAPNYDRLNHIISLGMDVSWRKKALRKVAPFGPRKILDVATGTGDLAIDMCQTILGIEKIIGIDISDEMLRLGNRKIRELELEHIIELEKQDCTSTSFEDNTFDAVTTAFGLRNFENIPLALKELYRVLKPGSPLMILELSEPRNSFVKCLYSFYANHFIPFTGNIISHDKEAYTYLPKSIADVPQREKLAGLLKEAGFDDPYYQSFEPGTCTVYMAIK
ncbi:ubiquinone biosynthesis methyltransferase UbiE [Porphyromonas macacae]|uniref:Demethylmenaquinone methyltransferase n=1 Tax=Porphyromonas macacae TaxID=28115 RepID=A0A379EAB0_9PORP|nr:bifunctional demethylmenaquinone methyltransferase/2-methoxy-6-polyprenyl-1,4-benzoquinol methylase UbiE [Porphyromonas macacae]KGO00057.1 ubiquinone biosynthesis methyltransferase UbiE [Porphyromonas macacae]SUB89370.1 Demethylmenaquinone methyltransferase [Porphyromonas macacae]